MTRLSLTCRSSHIHGCRRREALEKSEWAQYCYRCFLWIYDVGTWTRHCEEHLAHLGFRCEVKTSHYTLITPGLCPFCVGDCQLPANESFYQWESPKALWDHVQTHMDANVEWPLPCPHPMCNIVLQDAKNFDHHMVDMHGKSYLLGSHAGSTAHISTKKSHKSVLPKAQPNKMGLRSGSLSSPGQSVFSVRPVIKKLKSE